MSPPSIATPLIDVLPDKAFQLKKEDMLTQQLPDERQRDTTAVVDTTSTQLNGLGAPTCTIPKSLTAPVAFSHPDGSIYCLIDSLKAAFDSERQLGFPINYQQPAESFTRLDQTVRKLMKAYTSSHDDWRKFAFFNPHHYVRNLVDSNDDFELIVICWGPGQYSRIHNHASSHCWLTCLDGAVEEGQYVDERNQAIAEYATTDVAQMPAGEAEIGPCPHLKQCHRATVMPGETAYINDYLCLHSVGCPASVPAPGSCTLHLYAPPIKRATIFVPDEGRVVQRIPGFFSVRGARRTTQE
mmetsp:Transcript_16602/g.35914  ORF Transcript_16602/g.35914 Transcript_16602/m.35914 type:complete len:298 (-) Transcript_16602:814-1707(-)